MTDPNGGAAIDRRSPSLSRNPPGCNIAQNCQPCTKATRISVVSQQVVDADGRVEYWLASERMPKPDASARKIRGGIAVPQSRAVERLTIQ
jgi:hypothetical protein